MKMFGLYVMSVLYVFAGINHFVHSKIYLSIMPSWLPSQLWLVYISGALEIILGLLLLPLATRCAAAWAIIVLLIAIFPANIQMSLNYYRQGNPYFWLTLLRLPLQFVLIWWAYIYTKR